MPVKLHVDNISLSFGGIKALQAIEFQIDAGQIFAVIGPNGAGKTSLINSINGFYTPQAGRIIFEGADISASAALRSGEAGHLPHLSEYRALYQRHRARQSDGGAAYPYENKYADGRPVLGTGAARGNRPSPACRGDHRFSRIGAYPQIDRRHAELWLAQAGGAGTGAGAGADACCCWTSRWRA